MAQEQDAIPGQDMQAPPGPPSTAPMLKRWGAALAPTGYEQAGMVQITPPAWVLDAQTRAYLTQLADLMAQADLLPKGMSKPAATIAMFAGIELGMAAIESLNSLTVINNRIGWFTRALQGRMNALGLGKVETVTATEEIATVRVTNSHTGVSEEVSFTLEEATVAGYYPPVDRDGKPIPKSPWHLRRRDMLWNRAVSRAIKRICPEALGSIATTESDLEDIPQPEINARVLSVTETEVPPPPRFLASADILLWAKEANLRAPQLMELLARLGNYTLDSVPARLEALVRERIAELGMSQEPTPPDPEPEDVKGNPLADEEAGPVYGPGGQQIGEGRLV